MRDKKGGNELFQFFGGLALLVAGLYWFSASVKVTSSIFGGMFMLGGFQVTSGMIMVPFIIAIVIIFVRPDSFGAKIFLAISILIIVAAVIASTRIYLTTMSLYEWAGILVCIFGGLALVCKVLFKPVEKIDKSAKKEESKENDIEKELEDLKKNN